LLTILAEKMTVNIRPSDLTPGGSDHRAKAPLANSV
jgi:hypothetical protein